MAKHTPGPLRITADADDWSANHEGRGISCYCGIRDAGGTVVALAVAQSPNYHDDPDCRAIAARIVQCVNAHDELVAMLKEATDDYAANCEGGEADEWVGFARALLAKATGSAA